MLSGGVDKRYFWYWPAIVLTLLLLLALVQIVRVNKRPGVPQPAETYTSLGTLIQDEVHVAARDYYAMRINLNRRAKLTGVFRTSNLKSVVSVLVIEEKDFNNWKLNFEYNSIVQTGFVPGGKIAPVLEPGTYYLVIDNRGGDRERRVRVEFILE
jgi:hypothetical protein